jgi:hypothetical protein
VPVQVSAPEASRALEWEWLAGLQLMAPAEIRPTMAAARASLAAAQAQAPLP